MNPSPQRPAARLSVDDAVVLLVHHQTGLLSLVQYYGPDEFKDIVLALADTAKFFVRPTILTTSFESSPAPAKSTPGTKRTSSW